MTERHRTPVQGFEAIRQDVIAELRAEVLDSVMAEVRAVIRAGGLSTEEVRRLARLEAEAEGRRQQEECVKEGPVCGIWEEIGEMRANVETLRMEQTKLLAVLGFWKWALPIVVTVVGIVVGTIVPRLWPVQPAHGAQTYQVQK